MRNVVKSILVFSVIAIMFNACEKKEKDRLVGKWRIANVEFAQFNQQKEFTDRQITMLQDSLTATTDSAKLAQFNELLANAKMRNEKMQAEKDTMINNSRWEFSENGDFKASEMGGENKGIWSYDEEKSMLFTVIDQRTTSVNVRFKQDTMVLQFDSLNYISFVKMTE